MSFIYSLQTFSYRIIIPDDLPGSGSAKAPLILSFITGILFIISRRCRQFQGTRMGSQGKEAEGNIKCRGKSLKTIHPASLVVDNKWYISNDSIHSPRPVRVIAGVPRFVKTVCKKMRSKFAGKYFFIIKKVLTLCSRYTLVKSGKLNC